MPSIISPFQEMLAAFSPDNISGHLLAAIFGLIQIGPMPAVLLRPAQDAAACRHAHSPAARERSALCDAPCTAVHNPVDSYGNLYADSLQRRETNREWDAPLFASAPPSWFAKNYLAGLGKIFLFYQ